MDIIETLRENGKTIRECDDYRAKLVVKRNELVRQARTENHTWRELAEVLAMTEHGLIKSAKA